MSELIGGIILLAIVYMLVKPGSPSVKAITGVTTVFANLIHAAVRGGE